MFFCFFFLAEENEFNRRISHSNHFQKEGRWRETDAGLLIIICTE